MPPSSPLPETDADAFAIETAEDAGPDIQHLSARLFAQGGWLHQHMGLEYRPQQEQMANAAAAAFAGNSPLLFEAGTSVGKSLAYLLPGIMHAKGQGRQLIVSTHTKALQSQLQHKDLPLCQRIFAAIPELEAFADFRFSLLQGRENYLCTTRLDRALDGGGTQGKLSREGDLFYGELLRIEAWAKHHRDALLEGTHQGLREEMLPQPDPEVWEAVNAASALCSPKRCDPARCRYQHARARQRSAQVLIINHALLFSLMPFIRPRPSPDAADAEKMKPPRGVLWADDFLVLDEAHTVPGIATRHLGLSLSSHGAGRALLAFYNPKTEKGSLAGKDGARGLVTRAQEEAQQFFQRVAQQLLMRQSITRLHAADAIMPPDKGPFEALWQAAQRAHDALPKEDEQRAVLADQVQRVQHLYYGCQHWCALAKEGHVYWAERSGRKHDIITLRSAPIDVAEYLNKRIFGAQTGVLCASATLTVEGSMAHFAQTCGAAGAEGLAVQAVQSPFDYARCMRIYAARDVPQPAWQQDSAARLVALVDYIRFCIGKVAGGTLVLFTSYQEMQDVAGHVRPHCERAARPFLIQQQRLSPMQLARDMQQAGNAVLFGTDSFWTGIDVPGAALSQVIITRLPFEVYTHPIAQARQERIQESGGSPFMELALPEAITKFRQGAGRLIRSASDRGILSILDARVLQKTYGKSFLASLPHSDFIAMDRRNRAAVFADFSR